MVIAYRVLFFLGIKVVEVSHQYGIKLEPVIGPRCAEQSALIVGRGQPANGLGNAECDDGQADEQGDAEIESRKSKGEESENYDATHMEELEEEVEFRMVLGGARAVINNGLAQAGGIGAGIWGANALDVLFAEKLVLVRGGWHVVAQAQVHRGWMLLCSGGWPVPMRLRKGEALRGLVATQETNEYKVVPMSDSRFPRSVFAVGADPDPRFTLANERTFLAWIRTSLALIAGGVALEAFDVPLPGTLRAAVSVFMLIVAIILPVVAWGHWKQSERAMRENRSLPFSFGLPVLVAVIVVVAGALLVGEFLV